MQIITVSKAIDKIQKAIRIIGWVMIAFWGLCLSIIIKFQFAIAWMAFAFILSVILVILVRSYLILKWKIDAFERVDDLLELIERAKNSRIIDGSPYPDKWSIGTKADKEKVYEIISKRIELNQTTYEFVDDASIHHTFKIESSKKNNIIYSLVCGALTYQPLSRLLSETSVYPLTDYGMSGALLIAALYFLMQFISPKQIVNLSNAGVWTKKLGFQQWKAIDEIAIENKLGSNQERIAELVIVYNERSGVENGNEVQKFNVKEVNKTADEIEHALKIYKQRIKKTTTENSSYTLSKKPSISSSTDKNAKWFVFIAPLIIIIFGTYTWSQSLKDKESYDFKKGTITYIDTHFEKYKNRATLFLQLDNDPTVFKLFIGKERGDFCPVLDQTDALQINDEITIYYDKFSNKKEYDNTVFNNSITYIVKNNDIIFHDETSLKYAGYLIIGVGILLLFIILILKLKRKL
ncbi:hypothetical protein [Flavobacterium sp. SM2513]|uniref:hypothetical protein n=1 Tax=Flavobacterium sp. SM2513 TaxID=3424766 RepID=UPI003D7F8B6E